MCGSMVLNERHYHRGELNNLYMEQLKEAGLRCSGVNPTTRLVEVVEIVTHKLMVGVQFQPEYNNSALQPNELIMGFVRQVKEEIK
jgi:CTP synthase